MKKKGIVIFLFICLIIGVGYFKINQTKNKEYSNNKGENLISSVVKEGNLTKTYPNYTEIDNDSRWRYSDVLMLKEKYPEIIGYQLNLVDNSFNHEDLVINYNHNIESDYTNQFKRELIYNDKNEVIAGQFSYNESYVKLGYNSFQAEVFNLFSKAPIPLLMGREFQNENEIMLSKNTADELIKQYQLFGNEELPQNKAELLNREIELIIPNAANCDFDSVELGSTYVNRYINEEKSGYIVKVRICGIVDEATVGNTIYFYQDNYFNILDSLFDYNNEDLYYDSMKLIVKTKTNKMVKEMNALLPRNKTELK